MLSAIINKIRIHQDIYNAKIFWKSYGDCGDLVPQAP